MLLALVLAQEFSKMTLNGSSMEALSCSKGYYAAQLHTDARSCYQTPQILISDLIDFRENQE